MANISAKDVAKLRKMTGAGMMDCKKALAETEGDFDKAVEFLRKKGQKIASKRADKEASEGVVLAQACKDGKSAAIITLNCETDFVAKTDNFMNLANSILEVATKSDATDLDGLKNCKIGDRTVAEEITNATGVIGEKMELSYFSKIKAENVSFYIHQDRKLSTTVGFNKPVDEQVAKDIAMQIAAMNPVAINQADVPADIIEKELEIGKELAINEGKPAEMAEKIAKGRLGKFFKENTLLNQAFVKDSKMNIKQYLASVDKDLTVTVFKRHSIRD